MNADILSNGNGNGTNGHNVHCTNGHLNRCRSNSSSERLNALGNNNSNLSTERLGGSSDIGPTKLTEAGREYGVDLGRYLKFKYEMNGHPKSQSKLIVTKDKDLGLELMVLTGTSSVHTDTVSHLRMLFRCYNTPLLNELRGGDLQGMVRFFLRLLFHNFYFILDIPSTCLFSHCPSVFFNFVTVYPSLSLSFSISLTLYLPLSQAPLIL